MLSLRPVQIRVSGPSGSGGRQSLEITVWSPDLLYTRRIGGQQSTLRPGLRYGEWVEGKPTELVGAVKAVGQTGNLRYGLLTAFEKDAEWRGI